MQSKHFSKKAIIELLRELSRELEKEKLRGEILILGGSAMVIAYRSRVSTKDIDALFEPKKKIYAIARRIAHRRALPDEWLNDAVKGFMSDKADYVLFHDFPALKVFVPVPEYMFAMKALSMRIGAESRDVDDLTFLAKKMRVKDVATALEIISRYFPQNQIPQRTFYALEEIIQKSINK